MAKIDVSKIEGYADMTSEQKLTMLEAYEISDPDYSGYVKKETFDKTASELAEIKRKHNAMLSEEEQKKQATEEELKNLRQQVADMGKRELISSHKAKFLAMGYDEALATATAEAMANGETDKVFANQKKFLETHDKSIKAELLGKTPKPKTGAYTEINTDYTKMINDAQTRKDFSAVAYYTRLAEQEKQNNS